MLTPKPGAMLRGHDAVTLRADLATGVTVPMVAFIVVVAGVIAAHGPAGRVSATFMAGAGYGFAWGSVPVGLATMALIVVLRRAAPRWPGLILALALGSGLAALLPEMGMLAGRFGALPDRLPWPALPDLAPGWLRELLPSSLVIAFLAGIGSLLPAIGTGIALGYLISRSGRPAPSASERPPSP